MLLDERLRGGHGHRVGRSCLPQGFPQLGRGHIGHIHGRALIEFARPAERPTTTGLKPRPPRAPPPSGRHPRRHRRIGIPTFSPASPGSPALVLGPARSTSSVSSSGWRKEKRDLVPGLRPLKADRPSYPPRTDDPDPHGAGKVPAAPNRPRKSTGAKTNPVAVALPSVERRDVTAGYLFLRLIASSIPPAPNPPLRLPELALYSVGGGRCCQSLQAERRITVRDQNDRVPDNPVVPSQYASHEVEKPSGVAPCGRGWRSKRRERRTRRQWRGERAR